MSVSVALSCRGYQSSLGGIQYCMLRVDRMASPGRALLLLVFLIPPAHAQIRGCAVAQTGGTLAGARAVLHEALKTTEAIEDEATRRSVLHLIVTLFVRAGDPASGWKIVERFENTPYHRPLALVIATTQARFGDVPGALRTAYTLNDAGLQANALSSIAYAQAWAGDFGGALLTAHAIPDPHNRIKSEALASVGYMQGALGDPIGASVTLDAAEKVVDAIPDGTARVETLVRLARTRAGFGDRSGSIRLIQQAVEMALTFEKENQRAMSLYRIGRGQAATKDFEGAIRTADRIADDSMHDGVLRAIVSALQPIRDRERLAMAFRVFSLMWTAKSKDMTRAQIAYGQLFVENLTAALETAGRIEGEELRTRVQETVLVISEGTYDSSPPRCTGLAAGDDTHRSSCSDEQLLRESSIAVEQGAYDEALRWGRLIRDSHSRQITITNLGSSRALPGGWRAALGWARSESPPALKAAALLGVARGMLTCLRPEIGATRAARPKK